MTVNYIKHLENIFAKISLDDRLSTVHLGLYYSLFHQWNLAKFQNPISICRSELMKTSKVGSANTYTRCLRELNDWGYIDYKPSNNPCRGSLVNLYRFDTSTDNSCDNGNDITPVIEVRPSINSINNINKKKHINIGKGGLSSDRTMDDVSVVLTPKSKREIFISPSLEEKAIKLSTSGGSNEVNTEARKGSSNSRGTAMDLPNLEQVKEFFKEKNKTDLEAEKFFNHFESNGWLVGGKSKMKNWQAAARNWISRSEEYTKRSLSLSNGKPGNLNVNQNKDYSVPL